jgi:non-ribosomal peptide synthetase component F
VKDPSTKIFSVGTLFENDVRKDTRTLPERLEAVARRAPRATAVRDGRTPWSYAELNARANRLAHHLIDLGVGGGQVVGVAVPQSIDMVVCTLAVLKAGAACLPLDPSCSLGRLHHMLTDAAPSLVLAAAAVEAALPETAVPTVCYDMPDMAVRLWEQPEHDPTDADRGHAIQSGHLACLVYASGPSRSECVAMTHHQLATASSGSGVSVFEIFGPLVAGGCVEFREPDPPRQARAFVRAENCSTAVATAGSANRADWC